MPRPLKLLRIFAIKKLDHVVHQIVKHGLRLLRAHELATVVSPDQNPAAALLLQDALRFLSVEDFNGTREILEVTGT